MQLNGLTNYIEREVKRRAFVVARWNFREQEKQEMAAEAKRKAGVSDTFCQLRLAEMVTDGLVNNNKTHAHVHAHMKHTHMHACTHARTYTHTHARMYTHAKHMHACIHAHAHRHARMHTHTHSDCSRNWVVILVRM